jgi:hypothetical protein
VVARPETGVPVKIPHMTTKIPSCAPRLAGIKILELAFNTSNFNDSPFGPGTVATLVKQGCGRRKQAKSLDQKESRDREDQDY